MSLLNDPQTTILLNMVKAWMVLNSHMEVVGEDQVDAILATRCIEDDEDGEAERMMMMERMQVEQMCSWVFH